MTPPAAQPSPPPRPSAIAAAAGVGRTASPEAPVAASPTPSPIPLPSLKPGEVITWIRIEPFKFPLGQIVFSSLAGVGLAILLALSIGIFLGHLKSRKTDGQNSGGLDLR